MEAALREPYLTAQEAHETMLKQDIFIIVTGYAVVVITAIIPRLTEHWNWSKVFVVPIFGDTSN